MSRALLLTALLCTTAGAEPLNIVFFLVDDLGWRDLGCFGSTFYETPNIDRLCRRAMKFTNAYAACPVCSPTRASIMTGKYPVRFPLTDYLKGRRKGKLLPADYLDYMPLEETTLAEALKAAGYKTFFAGKWHLGPEGYWPENQGFDVNKGGWTRGGPYGGGKYFSPYGNPRLSDGPRGEHLPDRLARETVQFIQAHRDQAFLAYLAFYSVHTPLMARSDLREKYKRKAEKLVIPDDQRWGQERARRVRRVQDHAVYGGMVEAVDLAVGKVIAGLQAAGVADHTAIVFMSDNGGLSTSEGSPTSNLPLRGGKGWPYEGGIREPMFILWPGETRPGSVCDVPVISTDFYPTLLEMAGLPLRPQQHTDGVSLVPLLRGAKSLPERPLYWHYPHYGNQGGAPCGAVRLGHWKLIEWFEDNSIELYNLKDDIGELRDRSKDNPDKASELRDMLHRWRKSVHANMPKPNPDYDPAKDPRNFQPGKLDSKFAVVHRAAIDPSPLGFALRTRPRETGFALNKLARPLAGLVTLRARLQTMVDEKDKRRYRNGFIFFGPTPNRSDLVRCGVYLGGRRLYVIEDGDAGNVESVTAPLKADANRVFELSVTVDLKQRRISMTAGDQKLSTKLLKPWTSVAYVGCGANHTTTAFSNVSVSGK